MNIIERLRYYGEIIPSSEEMMREASDEIERLRAELAAAQAREKAKTEVLEKLLSWIDDWCDTSPETGFDEIERLTDSVLDMPTDDTALRQAIKAAKEEMRERCAVLCESYQWNAETCAAAIRMLEVE
jgi:chromosome segregation ATPase